MARSTTRGRNNNNNNSIDDADYGHPPPRSSRQKSVNYNEQPSSSTDGFPNNNGAAYGDVQSVSTRRTGSGSAYQWQQQQQQVAYAPAPATRNSRGTTAKREERDDFVNDDGEEEEEFDEEEDYEEEDGDGDDYGAKGRGGKGKKQPARGAGRKSVLAASNTSRAKGKGRKSDESNMSYENNNVNTSVSQAAAGRASSSTSLPIITIPRQQSRPSQSHIAVVEIPHKPTSQSPNLQQSLPSQQLYQTHPQAQYQPQQAQAQARSQISQLPHQQGAPPPQPQSAKHPNFLPAWPDDDDDEDEDDEEDGDGEAEEDTSIQQQILARKPAVSNQAYTNTTRAGSSAHPQYIPDSDPRYPAVNHTTAANGKTSHVFDNSSVLAAVKKNRVIPDSEDEEDEEGNTLVPLVAAAPTSDAVLVSAVMAPHLKVKAEGYQTSSGRRTTVTHVVESESEDELRLRSAAEGPNYQYDTVVDSKGKGKGRAAPSRSSRRYAGEDSDGEGSYKDEEDDDADYGKTDKKRRQAKIQRLADSRKSSRNNKNGGYERSTRSTRSRRANKVDEDDDAYEERQYNRRGGRNSETSTSDEEILELTDTESQDELMASLKGGNDKEYRFRKRAQVNYSLPAMFGLNPDGTPKEPDPATVAAATAAAAAKEKAKQMKKRKTGYGAPKHLPFSMSGTQLSNLFGEPPDSSDSDNGGASPRKNAAGGGAYAMPGALAAGGTGAFDYGSGNAGNLGKVSGATSELFKTCGYKHRTVRELTGIGNLFTFQTWQT
jgi:hypothetical protein